MTTESIKDIIEWGKKLAELLRESRTKAAAQVDTPKKAYCWYAVGLAGLAAAALLGLWFWTAGAGGLAINARIKSLKHDADAAAKQAEQTVSDGKRREEAAIHAAVSSVGGTDADHLPDLLAGLLGEWRKEHPGY